MDSRAPARFRSWIDAKTVDGIIAVPSAAAVDVSEPGDVAWLQACMTPRPRRSFAEPTTITGAVDALTCRAVVCVPGTGLPFARWAAEFGWAVARLPSGHDAMVTAPVGLAALLLDRTW